MTRQDMISVTVCHWEMGLCLPSYLVTRDTYPIDNSDVSAF